MPDQTPNWTLPLIIGFIIIIVGAGGGAYYFGFMHQTPAPTQNTIPNTTDYQADTTQTSYNPTQTTSSSTPSQTEPASAKLDQKSLTSTSTTPTITGSFANMDDMEIVITKSTLPQTAMLTDTIAGMVWDDRSDHGGGVELYGDSSGTFLNAITTPLIDGTYNVGVYTVTIYYPQTDESLTRDTRTLLTSGTLTIKRTK